MPLWDWTELCHALGCAPRRGPSIEAIEFDTRKLTTGDLFVALPGDPGPRFHASSTSKRDGHDFIPAADLAGAAGILVNRTVAADAAVLRVAVPTIDALWRLAAHRRRQIRGPVIGITGSSGKTTMTTFVSAVLDREAPPGSFNNYIGVPYRLVNTPRGAGPTVFEIGMNHPGEIAPLARLAQPDIAVVLNVLPVHLENFVSIDGIRAEKFSIADGLVPGGVLVHPTTEQPSTSARTLTFGDSGDVAIGAVDGDRVDLNIAGVVRRVKVPGGGEHRAYTVAATAAVVVAAELDLADLDRLETVDVPAGRGQRSTAGGIELIDESYNANPRSMAAALSTLAAMQPRPGGRRVAILGEMLELGDDSPRYHRELAAHCHGIDGIVGVGDGIRPLIDALDATTTWGWFADATGALPNILERLHENDVVLIKGSNRVFWLSDFVRHLSDGLAERQSPSV